MPRLTQRAYSNLGGDLVQPTGGVQSRKASWRSLNFYLKEKQKSAR